jgi:hypothetical protein
MNGFYFYQSQSVKISTPSKDFRRRAENMGKITESKDKYVQFLFSRLKGQMVYLDKSGFLTKFINSRRHRGHRDIQIKKLLFF